MKLLGLNYINNNSSTPTNSKLINQSISFITNNYKLKIDNLKNESIKENNISKKEIEENSCNNILINNGMSKEMYERLKNENINFIQTLLRLKEKTAISINNKNQSDRIEQSNLYINKKINESINNKTNDSIFKKCTIPIKTLKHMVRKKEAPIKITKDIRKTNLQKNKRKFNNKSEILYHKKSITFSNNPNNISINSYNNNKNNNNNQFEKKNSKNISKIIIKQRTLSAVPNKKQIEKINILINGKNRRNKDIKSENVNRINSLNNTNSTGITNISINPNNEIPSAVINLFDDFNENEKKENVFKKINKHQFKQKKFGKNF
jgi:hypothetical protein